MPTYEYKSTAVHKHTERSRNSRPGITVCPHCGGHLERVLSALLSASKAAVGKPMAPAMESRASSGDRAPGQRSQQLQDRLRINKGSKAGRRPTVPLRVNCHCTAPAQPLRQKIKKRSSSRNGGPLPRRIYPRGPLRLLRGTSFFIASSG